MIRRTIIFEAGINCYDERLASFDNCEEGVDWPSPPGSLFYIRQPVVEEKDAFDESLTVWRDRMEDEFEEVVKEEGEKNCQDITEYHHLCRWEITVIDVKEEIVEIPIEIPRDVQLRIERIEEMIKEAETEDERMALEEELRKLKDRYGIK